MAKPGFYRTAARAAKIAQWGTDDDWEPANTLSEAIRLALQLHAILRPIRLLNPNSPPTTNHRRGERGDKTNDYNDRIINSLLTIVTKAARLNHHIRTQGNVIYHFTPIFSDEEFDPERMTCANLRPVQRSCPLIIVDDDGRNHDPKTGDPTDIALVRVACFHGLTAYRKGGGETAERLLREEGYWRHFRQDGRGLPGEQRRRRLKAKKVGWADPVPEDGIRSRVLAKAVVALDWGKQRQFGARATERDRGYIELLDLASVDETGGKCVMS